MTGIFHQEMMNFILKPLYRPNSDFFSESGLSRPDCITTDEVGATKAAIKVNKEAIVYDRIVVFFASETG